VEDSTLIMCATSEYAGSTCNCEAGLRNAVDDTECQTSRVQGVRSGGCTHAAVRSWDVLRPPRIGDKNTGDVYKSHSMTLDIHQQENPIRCSQHAYAELTGCYSTACLTYDISAHSQDAQRSITMGDNKADTGSGLVYN